MKLILWIALAGTVGTLSRYGLTRFLGELFPGFPWNTLIINIIGSFIAGFCFIVFQEKIPDYKAYFPVFFIGFLGAFTTFSTYTLESARFLMQGQYSKFVCCILLQNGGGLAAACSGLFLATRIFH